MEILSQLQTDPLWRMAIATADVLLVAYVIYRVLVLIKGTRAVSVLGGVFLLIVSHLVAHELGLRTFDWLVGRFLTYGLALGLIVLFQDEIRRGLARLGRNGFFARFDRSVELDMIEEVVAAAESMASQKVGALIVIERTAELADFAEVGVPIDSRVTRELLRSIFHPGSALHDGAVIVVNGRIAAARCVLPLAGDPSDRQLGTRHQAALRLSEVVDAAVVVVSEERGEVGLAVGGQIQRPLGGAELARLLVQLYAPRAGAARRSWGLPIAEGAADRRVEAEEPQPLGERPL